MAELTSEERKKLSSSQFALPSKREFPIQDKDHARAALRLAPKSLKAGNITKEEYDMVIKKAKAKLGEDGESRENGYRVIHKNFELVRYNIESTSYDNYMVMDTSGKLLRKFSTYEAARNYAKYCAEWCMTFLNNRNMDSEMLARLESQCRANNGVFLGDRLDFTKKHGPLPSSSIEAYPHYGNFYYRVRFENIDTQVIFSSPEIAIEAMNNYVTIGSWTSEKI